MVSKSRNRRLPEFFEALICELYNNEKNTIGMSQIDLQMQIIDPPPDKCDGCRKYEKRYFYNSDQEYDKVFCKARI